MPAKKPIRNNRIVAGARLANPSSHDPTLETPLMDTALSVDLSRAQFALTAMFHIVWPVLTVGLSWFLVACEALWLKTGDPDWYRHARFWSKLFLLNFSVGVVSGLPLEFEFGTNWSTFSRLSGDFFGAVLGFEGAMAFMLEAGFLGIMLFGWRRVPRGVHLFATVMVATGASLSALWIMVANSWMQTPAGGTLINGVYVVQDYWAALFNPDMPWGVGHMWVAALETSAFVLGGISAAYMLKNRHADFFAKSFRVAVLAAVLIAPLQIWLGDGSGRAVFDYQPAKGAAIEGHWRTNPPGTGAPWALVAWPNAAQNGNTWSIEIPHALSLLATHHWTGQVTGLQDIPPADRPPALPLLFYSFRFMVAIGFYFLGLVLATLWAVRRTGWHADALRARPRLLAAWVAAVPLGYLAVESGWIVREVGRQPWLLYGVMRTEAGASTLPAATVAASLAGFAVLYGVLLVAFLVFARRLLRTGPDLELTPPSPVRSTTEAARHE
ncbi:MAG: cytochrome ubiquinol oxidase subunit I [Thiobacillus sp.]